MSVAMVYRQEYQHYDFGPEHPFRPERLVAAETLLHYAGLAPDDDQVISPPPASRDELQLIHTRAYLDAVERLDLFGDDPEAVKEALRWGLGPGDSPAFVGMHAAAGLIAGGTLAAVRKVLSGELTHVFHPAGGLHHAMPAYASGFCIYNDAAIAIEAALRDHGCRVLYVDFDAHHGDGVQAAFYHDPRVLTVSIHETGRHLFPGSGDFLELGIAAGHGYNLNLPVEPYTDDEVWLEALDVLIRPAAQRFQPDLIVSQHGCDSHALDPLSHLRLSTRAYLVQARMAHELAHTLAGGRWVALGGGGYDWLRVVPRSWAIVWAELSGRALPHRLPEVWQNRWAAVARQMDLWPLPDEFLDSPEKWVQTPRRSEIAETNRKHLQRLRTLVFGK